LENTPARARARGLYPTARGHRRAALHGAPARAKWVGAHRTRALSLGDDAALEHWAWSNADGLPKAQTSWPERQTQRLRDQDRNPYGQADGNRRAHPDTDLRANTNPGPDADAHDRTNADSGANPNTDSQANPNADACPNPNADTPAPANADT
jgi:hypothetical protein